MRQLRGAYPDATLIGLDTGYFANCLTNALHLPEAVLDVQYLADIRRFPFDLLPGVEAIVHLAAISTSDGKCLRKSDVRCQRLKYPRGTTAAWWMRWDYGQLARVEQDTDRNGRLHLSLAYRGMLMVTAVNGERDGRPDAP